MTRPTLRPEFAVQLGAMIEEAEKAVGGSPKPPAAPRGNRQKKTAFLSREESYERLDSFLDEAKAGAPDDWLARQANVSKEAVLWWRKEREIKRPRGRPTTQDRVLWAAGFGTEFNPQLHAAESELQGQWEAPEYLLRTPINYTHFCRHVHALHELLGSGPGLISASLGVRVRDVELALLVWKRHLREVGTPCVRCGAVLDPRYGKVCSTACRKDVEDE
jgi:hypothetical protein